MATETVNSTAAAASANFGTASFVPITTRIDKGVTMKSVASVACGVKDAASVYRMFVNVPSEIRITRLAYANDTGMTTLAGDIGVYFPDGGIVVPTTGLTPLGASTAPQNAFAAALSFATVHATWVDITLTQCGPQYAEKALWEVLGYAKDPHTVFDICMTSTTANTGAAGYLALLLEFVR